MPERGGRSTAFVHPIAAVGPTGEMHLIWGEATAGGSRTSGADQPEPVTRLYHAISRGGGWTAPELIYEAGFIRWHPLSVSRLATDSGGNLHLAFTSRHASGSALTYLKRQGGAWTRNDRIINAAPVYAEVAAGRSGQVVIAFVAPDASTDSPGDVNSVFVTRSVDGGRRWDAPRLVSRSGARQATEPELVWTGDGKLHLFVAKNLSGGQEPEGVWHFSSADGGGRWRGPAPIAVPGRLYGLRAVRGEGSHAVYLATQVETNAGASRLAVVRFDGNAWTAPEFVSPDREGFVPDIALDGEGRLHLVGYLALDPTRAVPDWVLGHSVRSSCRAGTGQQE